MALKLTAFLLLVVHSGAGRTHFGDIARNFQVLGVVLVGVHILPCAELADEADIVVCLFCIRDVDTHFLRNEDVYLLAQREQAFFDNLGIL